MKNEELQKVKKCKNPKNNPNCKGDVYTKKGLCRSCIRYGATYEEIYKNDAEKINNIKSMQSTAHKLSHKNNPEKYANNYFKKGEDHIFKQKSLYDRWVEKYGEEEADERNKKQHNWLHTDANPFKHLSKEAVAKSRKSTEESRPVWKDKHKESTTKNNQSKEFREKKSITLSEKISNGEFNPFSNHKHGHYIAKSGEDCYYQSLFELARMMQLDELNINWVRNHNIRIKYTTDIVHNYIPDLFIDNHIIEEIKPSALIDYNKVKHDAAIEYCKKSNYEFKIITELDINKYLEIALEFHNLNN